MAKEEKNQKRRRKSSRWKEKKEKPYEVKLSAKLWMIQRTLDQRSLMSNLKWQLT